MEKPGFVSFGKTPGAAGRRGYAGVPGGLSTVSLCGRKRPGEKIGAGRLKPSWGRPQADSSVIPGGGNRWSFPKGPKRMSHRLNKAF